MSLYHKVRHDALLPYSVRMEHEVSNEGEPPWDFRELDVTRTSKRRCDAKVGRSWNQDSGAMERRAHWRGKAFSSARWTGPLTSGD